uniref:NADH-plastoquinone oxidoreductase subunit K n=1 Tax=Calanthe davidii TaxID=309532 RepID=A0A2P1ENM7_9ASPA|nr:NADH-plastoquinone oxidoreductase subunit K [Calanthe davidii]AVM10464.1 NADH-plastoquinone oxidoreductase subunit K [Calanthe davidii]
MDLGPILLSEIKYHEIILFQDFNLTQPNPKSHGSRTYSFIDLKYL